MHIGAMSKELMELPIPVSVIHATFNGEDLKDILLKHIITHHKLPCPEHELIKQLCEVDGSVKLRMVFREEISNGQ
jgi:hypothetical protein|tara:strand:+ start:469 stop:696 length:228 start_codon:yes stop_codon:yes gene_type:complete